MSVTGGEMAGRQRRARGFLARAGVVAVAVFALLASPGRGEGSAPTPIRVPPADVVLPVHEVAHQAFEVGEVLQYEFGWKGIPAARATLSVQAVPGDEPARVKVIGSARTMSWLDWIWKMNDRFEAVFEADTLTPGTFDFAQRERGDKVDTHLAISWKDGVATSRRVKNGNTKDWLFPITRAYDPVTAAFLLRGVDLAIGDAKLVEVLNGKSRYLITMNVVGRETVTVPAGTFDTFRLEPEIRNPNVPPPPPEKRKLRKVAIWISTDAPRRIVKIESEVFWGSVYGQWTEPRSPNAPKADDSQAAG
ncbi:MAG: DUF3108 domain-containing protein [Deltaproteobacteria bacterium]|nr:DUF3108 domain-containing protein [Deltaproteobacteria bacterium]